MSEEVTRRPLGPNDVSSAEGRYEYVPWPAWRYDPDTGRGQIFESADEVPHGWTDIPPGTTPPGEDPIVVDETKLDGAGSGDDGDDQDGDGDDQDGDGDDGQDGGAGNVLLPEWTKDELVALGQTKLVEVLTDKNSMRKLNGESEIEFLPNWSKKKLADTILENGGYRAAKEA